MFKDIRGEAEEQIYIALRLKIDEFLDLAAYDWMLAEPQGTSSSYVTDLIAFLNSTFTAFTNLPVSLRWLVLKTLFFKTECPVTRKSRDLKIEKRR